MNEFEQRLADMQENWGSQKDAPQEDNRLPQGQYTMQLQGAEITESMASGKLMIHREHAVMDGEYTGRVAHDYMMLETEWGPQYIARWITQMGYQPPDDIRDLPDIVSQIADAAPVCMVQVKHSGEFQNLYIKKLLRYGSEVGQAPKAETTTTTAQAPSAAAGGDLEDNYDAMVAFCEAWQIPIGQSDTAETMREKIAELDWDGEIAAGNTDHSDQQLLMTLGLVEVVGADDVATTPETDDTITIPTMGQRVGCIFGDDVYYGQVIAVNIKGQQVTIEYDDGDTGEASFDELVPEPTPEENEADDAAPDDGQEDDQEVLTELVAFCQAQGMAKEVTEDDTIATLTEKVSQFEWHRSKLTPGEVELLENLDADIAWAPEVKSKKTAAKKTAAKKTAAKKTAAKKK